MKSIFSQLKAQGKVTFNVLFVCSGNICRSPMAEILYEKINQEDPLPYFSNVHIKSAAVVYQWNGRMDNYAEMALREEFHIPQARLNQFKSCHIRVDHSRFQNATLIITMEEYHIHDIPAEYHSKTYTLRQLATGREGDVDDPYGGGLTLYKATATEIFELLQQLHQKIKQSLKWISGVAY